jgi:hypothetical protein
LAKVNKPEESQAAEARGLVGHISSRAAKALPFNNAMENTSTTSSEPLFFPFATEDRDIGG